MSSFLRQYLTVAIFGGAAVLMVGLVGMVVRAVRVRGRDRINKIPQESQEFSSLIIRSIL